jgi:hypothetical protein
MGVTGTFCVVCGLPVEHDHYVPSSGMFKIYRGSRPGGGHEWEPDEDPFRFGPEHAWLRACVALSDDPAVPPRHGTVEDADLTVTGTSEQVFVADEPGELAPLHAHCWRLLGQPGSSAQLPVLGGSHTGALLARYQQQLFDFRELRDDGKGWMLEDPTGSSSGAARSAARLRALIAAAKPGRPQGPPAASVAEVLANDDRWGVELFGAPSAPSQLVLRRLRIDVRRGLDVSGYPDLVWLIKPYDAGAGGPPAGPMMDALDRFEVSLKASVEGDGAAVLVCVLQG